jgi:hypothetical protein
MGISPGKSVRRREVKTLALIIVDNAIGKQDKKRLWTGSWSISPHI